MFFEEEYEFVTEKEYMEYVQACSQRRHRWVDLSGQLV